MNSPKTLLLAIALLFTTLSPLLAIEPRLDATDPKRRRRRRGLRAARSENAHSEDATQQQLEAGPHEVMITAVRLGLRQLFRQSNWKYIQYLINLH